MDEGGGGERDVKGGTIIYIHVDTLAHSYIHMCTLIHTRTHTQAHSPPPPPPPRDGRELSKEEAEAPSSEKPPVAPAVKS
jgi:hypothetical protein